MEVRFGVQDAPHRTLPASAQRMINCYLEAGLPGARSPALVVASYGISAFNTLSDPKGASVIDGVLYVATKEGLYTVNSAGAEIKLASHVFADNTLIEGDGQNIVCLSDRKGYVWDGTTLDQITDSDFPVASWMGYVDGYFPVIEAGTGRFYINETAFAPKSWNGLDFSNTEGAPDALLWGIVDKRELILFGRHTTEIYYNSGNSDFPFSRVANGFIETGIISEHAAGKIATAVFFMGEDGVAYMLNGYTPQRISTHAVEQVIDGYTRECRCYTWHESGHAMVGFRFPEACWVYDVSTGLWHQRSSYNAATWNVDWIVPAHGLYITGGDTVGKLVADVFTEYTGILRSQCTSAAVTDRNNLIQHDRLELVFETGVGPGDVMLRFSDDGGRTWSNEKTATLGSLGDYHDRVIFHRLGSARDRVYEYAISDAYRRTLISANLNEWG